MWRSCVICSLLPAGTCCCALQGYVTYAAIVYVFVAFIGGSLLACGWVSYVFSKNGLVPNKW